MNSAPEHLELVLASPRGFCAGVDRAITIVEKAVEQYGPPIYVRHEIVHNPHVVNRLRERGVIFVEDIEEVPEGAHAIYSAHGVSPAVLDATCPLVTKVHGEAQRYARKDYTIVLVGHRDHVEVEGTVGEAPEQTIVVSSVAEVEGLEVSNETKVSYLTQTTLSLDDTAEIVAALRKRFPQIEGPAKDDICYATQNRQNAVKALAQEVDLVLIVGAANSSNTLRLVEVAQAAGVAAERIESAEQVRPEWFKSLRRVGITAGASAPEDIVQGIVSKLQSLVESSAVRTLELVQEDVTFALPAVLRA